MPIFIRPCVAPLKRVHRPCCWRRTTSPIRGTWAPSFERRPSSAATAWSSPGTAPPESPPATLKRASGTHLKLPVARVTNLGRTLDELSEKGFWIVGTAGEAELSIYDFDWKRPLVLVLGSEQKGIAPSVRKRCHQLVTIPSPGGVESLNVSAAGGVNPVGNMPAAKKG